jgi:multicomponent Na+:H+ antiporter subunit D
LVKVHPVLSVAFFVTAFSLAGLPPLSGFWAKIGVLMSAMEEKHWLMSFSIVCVSLFTLLSMVKIWLGAFWQNAPEESDLETKAQAVSDEQIERLSPSDRPWTLWAPCLTLALTSILLGLFGSPLYDYATLAAKELLDPTLMVKAVLNP